MKIKAFKGIRPKSNKSITTSDDKKIVLSSYIQEETNAVYLYQQHFKKHVQIGIVCCISMEEYIQNNIKKHEATRKDKEEKIKNAIIKDKIQKCPVLLTYRNKKSVDDWVSLFLEKKPTPLYRFVDDKKNKHILWKIDYQKTLNAILGELKKIKTAYIADGHHRAEAAVHASLLLQKKTQKNTDAEHNYFLVNLVPHNQLLNLEYNRIIKSLNGYKTEDFIKKLSRFFDIKKITKAHFTPQKTNEMGMYLSNCWYQLKIKKELLNKDVYDNLDVNLIQKYIFKKILGVHNPRTDKRIDFVPGVLGYQEIEKLVNKKQAKVGFVLFPINVSTIMKIADSGKVMPPKSTWFEPKIRKDLIFHSLIK